MELKNFWWLLIWLVIGGVIFGQGFTKRAEQLGDRIVQRWDYLPAIALVIPYIIWAGFRSNFGDTELYRIIYLQLTDPISKIGSYFTTDVKDPGFSALMVLMKSVIGNRDKLFFTIIAAFQMICLALTFRKYSSDYWMSIFLFIISTDYFSWVYNGMRQFIAVTIIFAAFGLMVRRKYISMILVILIAAQIHGSALLMIPVIFIVQHKAWNWSTILTLLITMVVVVYIDRFTPILGDLLVDTQYDDLMTNGIWEQDDGTNIIRVLVYAVPTILSLVGLPYVRAANDPVINICVNASIVTTALYAVAAVSSGIYIGRLPIYTTLMGYIALPWLIDHMFTRDSAKKVKGVMIVLYLAFFYYQTHITWGIL